MIRSPIPPLSSIWTPTSPFHVRSHVINKCRRYCRVDRGDAKAREKAAHLFMCGGRGQAGAPLPRVRTAAEKRSHSQNRTCVRKLRVTIPYNEYTLSSPPSNYYRERYGKKEYWCLFCCMWLASVTPFCIFFILLIAVFFNNNNTVIFIIFFSG